MTSMITEESDDEISDTTEDDEEEMDVRLFSGKNILNEKLKTTKVEGISEKIQRFIYKKLDQNFNNITQDESFPMFVKVAKQVLVSSLIIKFINSLNHEDPKAVARARICYTLFLLVSHCLIFYCRRKVARLDDQSEIEIRGQLPGMFQKLLGDNKSQGGSPLDAMAKDMTTKMLSKKMTVKEFDSKQLDNMFHGLLFPMLFNSFLHFKKGYVKPLMIQAAMGLQRLLKSPLIQIHVFGKSAEGELERPFRQQSKMLEKMMSQMAAQSEAAQEMMKDGEKKEQSAKPDEETEPSSEEVDSSDKSL